MAGTYTCNGESAAAVARLQKLVQTGRPLLFLNNTGGVSQAFASLHQAMVEGGKNGKPLNPIQLQKAIQLVQPNQKWSTEFGMPEVTMLREREAKDPKLLTNSLSRHDVLSEPAEDFVARMSACMVGEVYTPPVRSKKEAKAAKKAAAAAAMGDKKPGLVKRILGARKKVVAVAPGNDGSGSGVVAAAVVNAGAKAGGGDMSSSDEDKRLKNLFDLVDRDSSGAIDFEEFKAGVFLMGFLEQAVDENTKPDDEEMLTWFDDADTDSSGKIEYEEFVALMKVEMKPKRRERKAAEKAAKADAAPAADAAAAS